MTICDMGGTLRLRPVNETIELLKPYADKAGITRLVDLTTLDDIGLPVYTCIRPCSKNLTTSQGKGITHELAICSAYMEGIENFYAETPYYDLSGSYAELKEKYNCIDPSTLQKSIFTTKNLHKIKFHWTEMLDLKSNKSFYIPSDSICLNFAINNIGSRYLKVTSTGIASGNTEDEASCHALLEVLERKYTRTFGRLGKEDRYARTIKLDTIDYKPARQLLDNLKKCKIKAIVFDISKNENTVPAYYAIFYDEDPLRKMANFAGFGSHVSKGVAICRALTEAAQSRLTYITGSRDDIMPKEYQRKWIKYEVEESRSYQQKKEFSFESFADMKIFLVTQCEEEQVLQITYTEKKDDISVVQIIAPGMQI